MWVIFSLGSDLIFGAMEKRTAQRKRVIKVGMIKFPGGAFSCMVRNTSKGGAALDVPSQAGIPNEFYLRRRSASTVEACGEMSVELV